MSGFSQILNNFPTFFVRLKLSLSPKKGTILKKKSNNQRELGFFPHLCHVAEMAIIYKIVQPNLANKNIQKEKV